MKRATSTPSFSSLDAARLGALASVGPHLVETLDLEKILARLLAVAREATGARYAAIGVLDPAREHLERFVTDGIEDKTRAQLGEPPHGHGILGELIRKPEPLRLARLGDHARSYGFPPGHPPMNSFLGVPVIIRGEVWGNLYLTEKEDSSEFTEADEKAVLLLASWAAIAIDHARLYEDATERRDELQNAVTALQATSAISAALGSESDTAHILELVVKRGRALVGARLVALFLARDDRLVLGAAAGEAGSVPADLPRAGNLLGNVLDTQRTQRIEGHGTVPPVGLPAVGFVPDSAILVPLSFRGESFGVLAAIGSHESSAFDRVAEDLLTTFAVNAGAAVATARQLERTVQDKTLAAAEAERGRWARELHDETLQELAAIKLALAAAARYDDPDKMRATITEIAERVDSGVRSLRHLITELRPAELDELGTEAALEQLVQRTHDVHGLQIDVDLDMAYEAGRSPTRHAPELEAAVYRLAQEALTNIVKHANAHRATIELIETDALVELTVTDDGDGFDSDQATNGFGLLGMRERVAAFGGEVTMESSPGNGTTVTARIPVRRLPDSHTNAA